MNGKMGMQAVFEWAGQNGGFVRLVHISLDKAGEEAWLCWPR